MTNLAAPLALATPRCTKTCRRETAACKQAQCTGLAGERRRACMKTCDERNGCPPGGPAIRGTLAYVVTECREDAAGLALTWHQALKIRRGDCDAVTVYERPTVAPAPDPIGFCRLYGFLRWGDAALLGGGVERLGVRPDGSAVVFEVTFDTATFHLGPPPPDQEGIYFVRADGSGLHRLGPASRRPALRLIMPSLYIDADIFFSFSPDGRTIVFTDLGSGGAGEDTVQIVTLDVTTGRRTQLTRLPAVITITNPPGIVPTCCAHFLNAETVEFSSYANPSGMNPAGDFLTFTVKSDGTGLRAVPAPLAAPGSTVVPVFGSTRPSSDVLTLASRAPSTNFPGIPAHEVFLRDGKNLLQLTNFGHAETFGLFLTLDQRRVILSASADPVGSNPKANCQLFSIDTFGAHLHQLTHFDGGERSPIGHCLAGPPPGCSIPNTVQDQETGTIVFESSCDPFGTNPYGSQLFAMRPDGSGLHGLTDTGGFAVEADDSVVVELPGPFDYSAPGHRPQFRF